MLPDEVAIISVHCKQSLPAIQDNSAQDIPGQGFIALIKREDISFLGQFNLKGGMFK